VVWRRVGGAIDRILRIVRGFCKVLLS
jgi:hypothetical protein